MVTVLNNVFDAIMIIFSTKPDIIIKYVFNEENIKIPVLKSLLP